MLDWNKLNSTHFVPYLTYSLFFSANLRGGEVMYCIISFNNSKQMVRKCKAEKENNIKCSQ